MDMYEVIFLSIQLVTTIIILSGVIIINIKTKGKIEKIEKNLNDTHINGFNYLNGINEIKNIVERLEEHLKETDKYVDNNIIEINKMKIKLEENHLDEMCERIDEMCERIDEIRKNLDIEEIYSVIDLEEINENIDSYKDFILKCQEETDKSQKRETKNYNPYIEYYSEQLKIDEHNAYALLMIGKSYESLEDYENAEIYLIKAKLSSKSYVVDLIEFYFRRRNYENILKTFNDVENKVNIALFNKGNMYKPLDFLRSVFYYINNELDIAEKSLIKSLIKSEQVNEVIENLELEETCNLGFKKFVNEIEKAI